MSAEPQPGDWYEASDGQWYCWPSPIPYAGPPVPAPPERPRGWIPSAAERPNERASWLARHLHRHRQAS